MHYKRVGGESASGGEPSVHGLLLIERATSDERHFGSLLHSCKHCG